MGSMTIDKLFDLINLAVKAEYDFFALKEIEIALGEIFGSNEIRFEKNVNLYDNEKDENTRVILIKVDGKEYGFYEIKNIKNSFADLIIEHISVLLNEVYTNILKRFPEHLSGEIDLLTKVYSRNAFENFKNNFNSKEEDSVSCVFVDINGMNEINKNYGHSHGDLVISNIADFLKQIFANDKIFRFGGDEFVVIVKNIDEKVLEDMIIKLQEQSENQGISISIGTSTEYNVKELNKLIEKADYAMYQQKSNFYENKGKCMRKEFRTSSI